MPEDSAVKLSVVVPCYNEEKNIPGLVEHFAGALSGEPGVELLLVDNGSTDATGRVIDEALGRKGLAFARKVTVEKNLGYGFGILSGLREARGAVLAWTHADLQTDPGDVLRAYRIYQEKAPAGPLIVKGRRKNRKASEKLLSLGMQFVASAALGTWLDEVNAQPKLFPREFFDSFRDPPRDFSLDLYLLYQAKKSGCRIVSMPVYFKERRFGEAKGGSGSALKVRWKLIRRSFAYIFELRRRVKEKEQS